MKRRCDRLESTGNSTAEIAILSTDQSTMTIGAVVEMGTEDRRIYRKVFLRIVPFLFICYVLAFLDRVNIGFAKLQMAEQLQFSDAVFGLGAGIFFIGYFIFEVPSNVILERVGARLWIARIMVTWGIIASAMMFVEDVFWFYTLRFLLGAAEAGFFPGVILYLSYWFPAANRARVTGLLLTAVATSNMLGAPVSGWIMQFMDGANDWAGWQWLFLLEGLPSVLAGFMVFAVLSDSPHKARWLTTEERDRVTFHLEEDRRTRQQVDSKHRLRDAFIDSRIWLLSFTYLCIQIGFYAVNFWMPTLIQESGLDPQDYFRVGLLSIIPWGVAAIAMVLFGLHSDRTQERRWHTQFAIMLGAIGLAGLTMAASTSVSIFCLTLVCTGLLCGITVFWSLPLQFLLGTAAAAGIAWINSVGCLGGVVGPWMTGWIRSLSGNNELVFPVLAGVVAAGSLSLLFLRKTKSPTG